MSLLTEAMTDCQMIDRTTQADGYGGYKEVWKDGAEFKAAISINQSVELLIAQQQGLKEVYTVTTPKAVRLHYHDVFKRKEDGKIFRITGGEDKATPASATIDMRVTTAEAWEIPPEEE